MSGYYIARITRSSNILSRLLRSLGCLGVVNYRLQLLAQRGTVHLRNSKTLALERVQDILDSREPSGLGQLECAYERGVVLVHGEYRRGWR